MSANIGDQTSPSPDPSTVGWQIEAAIADWLYLHHVDPGPIEGPLAAAICERLGIDPDAHEAMVAFDTFGTLHRPTP